TGGAQQISFAFRTDGKPPHLAGATVGGDDNVSLSTEIFDDDPRTSRLAGLRMAAVGPQGYVLWQQEDAILFLGSSIAGAQTASDATFEPALALPPTTLSTPARHARNPALAAAGGEVYAAWQEEDDDASSEMWFRQARGFGAGFSPAVNLSRSS